MATGTYYSVKLGNQYSLSIANKIKEEGGYSITDLHKKTVKGSNNIDYGLDEYTSGVGDALTIMYKEIHSKRFKEGPLDSIELTEELVHKIKKEIEVATMYQIGTDYWNDCLRNGYQVLDLNDSIAVAPSDVEQDQNRAVSTYRRNHISFVDTQQFSNFWFHSFDQETREELCSIKLAKNIELSDDTITNINIGFSKEALDNAGVFIHQEKALEFGPLSQLLSEEFKNSPGISLRLVVRAWRFLISVSMSICTPNSETKPFSSILEYTPKIPVSVLTKSLAASLSIQDEIAERIVTLLTFSGSKTSELWFQPIIKLSDGYFILAGPCIASPRLDRTFEAWLEMAGIKSKRRGDEFEAYAIKRLSEAASTSPISDHIQVCKRDIKLTSIDKSVGEIDVLLTIGSTVLIVECKCIKWPEGAVAHSNYYSRVQEGIDQLDKRIGTIESDRDKFRHLLKVEGIDIPQDFKVVPILLVNTPTSVGLKVGNSYVADMSILDHYLNNRYVKFEESKGNKVYRQTTLSFYEDIDSAEQELENYLSCPTQIADLKKGLTGRTISMGYVENRPVNYVSHDVIINTSEFMQEYGISPRPIRL